MILGSLFSVQADRIRRGLLVSPRVELPQRPKTVLAFPDKQQREADRKRRRERHAYRVMLGQCTRCEEPAEPGYTNCRACRQEFSEYMRARAAELNRKRCQRKRAKRISVGQCVDCSQPAEFGQTRCAKHRQATRVYNVTVRKASRHASA